MLGTAVLGTAVLGTAVLGVAVDGAVVDGMAVDGVAVDGAAVDGTAVNGVAVDGVAVGVAVLRLRKRPRIHAPDPHARMNWLTPLRSNYCYRLVTLPCYRISHARASHSRAKFRRP